MAPNVPVRACPRRRRGMSAAHCGLRFGRPESPIKGRVLQFRVALPPRRLGIGTAYGGKGSKGRAVSGDRPIGQLQAKIMSGRGTFLLSFGDAGGGYY